MPHRHAGFGGRGNVWADRIAALTPAEAAAPARDRLFDQHGHDPADRDRDAECGEGDRHLRGRSEVRRCAQEIAVHQAEHCKVS